MALIKARNLARDYRANPQRTLTDVRAALELGSRGQPGGVRIEDFSLRDLAEELIQTHDGEPCGYRFVKEIINPTVATDFVEAMSAVDSTGFRNITGQLMVRAVLDSFRTPAFVLSALIPTRSTPFTRGEKVPGITLPKDPEIDHADWLVLNEGQEYKNLGFGEEYTELPATVKRGAIIGVTREMVFEDLTGLAARRAAFVGTILGLRKEKRLADVIIGYTNNYKEKRSGHTTVQSRNTYYSAADTSPPWINHLDANGLDDWTALDEADNMMAELTDPNTSEPIVVNERLILHPPALRSTVARILNATELRRTDNTSNLTISANVVRPGLRGVESTYLYSQLKTRFSLAASDARGYWFYGDPAAAFAYFSNWDITVLQAPTNSEAEFMQDIVLRFKATERGEAAAVEPRLMQRHRAVATSSSGS